MKKAVIIGAGPAGLTAAYEFCERSDIHPIVLERSRHMGGISRTVNYKGNRIDIGGHRFFSKSDRVMEWWLRFLPLQAMDEDANITYHRNTRGVATSLHGPDPSIEDKVMLVRQRRSRIYFMRKLFEYPISLSPDTVAKLGPLKMTRIGCSYLLSAARKRPEHSLEDFFINRFGRELYLTFFKSYTEKVWGVPCSEISAEWGAQRIKGLSIYKTLKHAAKRMAPFQKQSLAQKNTETSLIERFLYPKFGPGQMWDEVAEQIRRRGGEILTGWSVESIEQSAGRRILGIWARNTATGELRRFEGDFYFSTMPVKELADSMDPLAPAEIRNITSGLQYRDFMTVGLLCNRLKLADKMKNGTGTVSDNWIYIQEPDVRVGRLQIFNNWSPYMVADPSKTWIGLEYFCYQDDDLWNRRDSDMIELAKSELAKINILDPAEVIDGTVLRMPKTYPAYFGTYSEFPKVIEWANRFDNLFLIGRNGMHKYNNQDHSMLAAMIAVDNIIAGIRDRTNLWTLNTEMEYHEEKVA